MTPPPACSSSATSRLLGAFTSLMLAGDQGPVRIVTFALIVVMSDLGGYIVGVLIGKHPMAPRISPKKSWEGLAGSVVFGVAAGIAMTVFGLGQSWWKGPGPRYRAGRGRRLR